MSMAVGRDLEDVVLEAHQGVVGPEAQPAVLGQAVAADARPGKNHVGVGRPHLDGLDHLDQVDAVALGEQAPFVHEGQDRGAIGVLDDLAGFALDGPVEHGQGKLVDVEHLRQKRHDPFARFRH